MAGKQWIKMIETRIARDDGAPSGPEGVRTYHKDKSYEVGPTLQHAFLEAGIGAPGPKGEKRQVAKKTAEPKGGKGPGDDKGGKGPGDDKGGKGPGDDKGGSGGGSGGGS